MWKNTTVEEKPKKPMLSLKVLDEALKEMVKHEAEHFYKEPVLLKYLKAEPDKPWLISVCEPLSNVVKESGDPQDVPYKTVEVYAKTQQQAAAAYKAWKEEKVPDITVNAKLLTWGCPACGGKGCFQQLIEADYIRCNKCDTHFAYPWMLKWDGHPCPQMKGTKPSVSTFIPEDDDDDYDPIMNSMGSKLLALHEKVVLFREAVVNPDRVTTDEEVEELLKAVFEVSYTLPTPSEINDEVTKDVMDDVDLAPDTYESATAYAAQLDAAVKANVITAEQADDLFKAFGGDDPFESLEDKGIPAKIIKEGEISPDEVSKVPKITGVHDSIVIHDLNFETAEIEAPWFEGDGPLF